MVGRDELVAAVDSLARQATEGTGTGLVVRAVDGCGLSTFLHHVPTSFGGTLLRAQGRRDESHIPRAVLRELAAADANGDLGRLLNETPDDQLPEQVLAWVAQLAGNGAAAIVVDDVDAADPLSRSALTFAARRVDRVPVLVVLGAHDPEAVGDDLPTLELGPLPAAELADVLVQRYGLARPVAASVAAAAEGVPLVALEVARALHPAQRDGSTPLPEALLTHVSIPHAFADTMRALPDATRRALCVAAAEPSGELRAVAGALAVLGDHVSALEPAEEAGLVAIQNGVVRFDHPLRRNVAYHLLAAPSRRAAHRALAASLDAPGDAERRALHLSLGVVQPDEAIARDLDLVAELAERRRDAAEAARWWQRAADLSPAAADAARRRDRASRVRAGGVVDPLAGLTKTERKVAEVVAGGLSNKDAAAALFVSVKTVDTHLQSIYRKLGLASRTELAVLMAKWARASEAPG